MSTHFVICLGFSLLAYMSFSLALLHKALVESKRGKKVIAYLPAGNGDESVHLLYGFLQSCV